MIHNSSALFTFPSKQILTQIRIAIGNQRYCKKVYSLLLDTISTTPKHAFKYAFKNTHMLYLVDETVKDGGGQDLHNPLSVHPVLLRQGHGLSDALDAGLQYSQ